MVYTLTVCYGMFLAICGQQRSYDFQTREECEKERTVQTRYIGGGWAVCVPKKLTKGNCDGRT